MNSTYQRFFLSSIFITFTLIIFAQSGIYVGGHFRRDSLATVPTLKNSGFTYVILFNIQVESNGDLTMDNTLLCSDGVYTFASRHPDYVKDVTSLRTGWSSIQRVEKCIGGWGSKSYDNIKSLVKTQGTGKESILYKNFKALKEAIPVIEAINNDDEHTYDVETASAFHIMLYDLGYKTTIAPYTNKTFWQNFVATVNLARPGAVDRIDLQCYDGGAGNKNNPDAWKMGDIPLHAGLLHFESSANINNQMKTWKDNSTVASGFLWVYNANDFNLREHAKAITNVFGGGEIIRMGKMKPHVTVFPEKNFQGEGINFERGKFSNYAITSQNFKLEQLSSLKIHEGFKIELFEEDNQAGRSVLLDSDIADLTTKDISSVFSWTITANGDQSLKGKTFYLKNKRSGMYLSLEKENTTDGTILVQKELTGSDSQKWKFNHSSDGIYSIINQYSRRSIQARDASDAEGGVLEQGIYLQKANQHSIMLPTAVENEYKIMLQHSIKYIAVEAGNENMSGATIIQTENLENESAYWILEDISLSDNIILTINKSTLVYPNPAKNYLFINKTVSQIIVSDAQGSRVVTKNLSNNVLDISDLPCGVYFLLIFIEGSNETVVSKLIKL